MKIWHLEVVNNFDFFWKGIQVNLWFDFGMGREGRRQFTKAQLFHTITRLLYVEEVCGSKKKCPFFLCIILSLTLIKSYFKIQMMLPTL